MLLKGASMRESLDEDISVICVYDATKKSVKPYKINWHGREYLLGPIDFHHVTTRGVVATHHFSMSDVERTTYFKIAVESENLHWKLEEYMTADQAEVHYGKG